MRLPFSGHDANPTNHPQLGAATADPEHRDRTRTIGRFISGSSLTVGIITLIVALTCFAGSATAEVSSPNLRLTTTSWPTILNPVEGNKGKLIVALENLGGASTQGTITLHGTLPAGLHIAQTAGEPGGNCSNTGQEFSCVISESLVP